MPSFCVSSALLVVQQRFLGLPLYLVEFSDVYESLGCQRMVLLKRFGKFTPGMCPASEHQFALQLLEAVVDIYPALWIAS